MKKIFALLILASSSAFSQNPIESASQNWNNVFTDMFDGAPTYSNGILNLPNWKVKHGETRWLQEQVFTKDQVDIKDGSLFLKLSKCPGGCINQEYLGGTTYYKKGSNQTANFKGSEVYTSKKILYGYIEAKIKLPSGPGAFPGFWLFPAYRENQANDLTHYQSILFRKSGYPEEMDIIEQRSIRNPDAEGPVVSHVYDNYTFWDDPLLGNPEIIEQTVNMGANNQQSKPWEHRVFYDVPNNCELPLAGNWHTFGLKWDLFGQYYFLDEQLVFTNDLWTRKTNTESMNVLLSNQILTNTSDPLQAPLNNTYDNTVFDGKQILFPDDYIADEKVKVDWVKIWQEKKFKNPVVWASGKSDKLGKFELEVGATVPDTFIVGNFISTDESSEILSFASNGLSSSFQRLTNQVNLTHMHDYNMHINVSADDPQNEVWEVTTFKEEKRAALTPPTYTLNNWFSPATVAKTRYAVGNFDGLKGDELFISNYSTYYSILLKFMDTQNASVSYYEYQEKYNSNPTNNTNTAPTIVSLQLGVPVSQNISIDDVFVSGDLDGLATTVNGVDYYKDELIWFNTASSGGTKSLTVLTYEVSGSYSWKRVYNGTSNASLLSWTVAAGDKYLVGNFYKQNANDRTAELLCINSTSGLVHLYSFSGSAWTKLWGNDGANIFKINLFNMGSYGKDTFVCGTFTDQTAPTQLMCISGIVDNATTHSYQQYHHIYQFNGTAWFSVQLNEQVNQQMNWAARNYPSLVQHLAYKYLLTPTTYATTLLSIEKYKNPYDRNCTANATSVSTNFEIQKKSNCAKYLSTLTNFSSNTLTVGCSNCKTALIEDHSFGRLDALKEKIIGSIYPNPSKGNFTLDFTRKINAEYKIFNELSGVISEGSIVDSNTLTVNLSVGAKGIYFINIIGGNINTTEKIIFE